MDEIHKISEQYVNPSNVLFEEENFVDYRTGGFHPVALGDTLKDGRYNIRHKLGYGGFSTVWAARDVRAEQWVSIKITRADRPNRSQELRALRELAQYPGANAGSGHIVQLLDDFVHNGPNGSHQCLVFELLGPTINSAVNDAHHFGDRLDMDSIIKISTQMLEAVAFMHKVGYAHGDISTKNLAFCDSRLSRLSEEQLLLALGAPETDFLTRADGKPLEKGVPTQLVESAQWTGWPLNENEDECEDEDDNIRIIDLGEAFDENARPEKLAQPGGLQAPETIFTGRLDYRQDLWRAGLVLYSLVFGTLPYSWWGIYPLVEAMIDVFGELPPEWRPRWEQMRLEATAGGDLGSAQRDHLTDLQLEKQFEKHVHEPKLKRFYPVIKGLTRLMPSDRITASQALQLIRDNCSNSEHNEGNGHDPGT